MNIVITGMRGSGKSTVSRLLAKKLNKELIDLDKALEQKMNMPIRDVIKLYGWEYFRDKESEIAKAMSLLDNKIISTGGGVVTRESNIKVLKVHGVFVYLNTPLHILLTRIKSDKKRPRLTNEDSLEDEMKEILMQREKLYRDSADIIINTTELKLTNIPDKIIEELHKLNI